VTLIAMTLDVFVARLKVAIAYDDREEANRLMAEFRACDEMAIRKGYGDEVKLAPLPSV
jgi:hypothetical protein